MAGILKKTTGLTGLVVAETPRQDLLKLYKKTMKVLNQLPEESVYKKHTEAMIKEKNSIVEQNNNVSVIEEKIGGGQIEEVLIQAEHELKLARSMKNWKPWESLVEEAPPHQWTWPPHK